MTLKTQRTNRGHRLAASWWWMIINMPASRSRLRFATQVTRWIASQAEWKRSERLETESYRLGRD